MFNGPHYIKENKSVSIPKRCIFFDTETDQRSIGEGRTLQRYKLGVANYQRIRNINKPIQKESMYSYDHDELCNWIISKAVKKERLYILSANIWFDFRTSGMYQYLRKRRWKNKSFMINGMSIIMSFTYDKKTIVFLNIQNYFRTSVAKIGESIGLKKLDVNFNTVNNDDLLTYCQRDVDIIQEAMIILFRFIKTNELGNFGFTFPSIAFNIYRHKFMDYKILVHKNSKVTKLERAAYHGGRVECFKIGHFTNKDLIQIDINSMYPYVMTNNDYPFHLKYHIGSILPHQLDVLLDTSCITARCIINTNEPAYAVKHEGKCVFPIGKFECYLNTPGLQYAFDNGHLVKIIEASVYAKAPIFEKYVNYFYPMRLNFEAEGQKAFASLCKYLLNGLYGKFGQRIDELISESDISDDEIGRENYYDADTNEHYIITKFYGKSRTTKTKAKEGFNSLVTIAGHVTEHARFYLYKFMKIVGRERLYYCDTDCLIFNRAGFDMDQLPIHINKLGHFKIEANDKNITIRTLKDYTFGGKTKIKGVGKNATTKDNITYEQTFFPGIYTELHRGISEEYITNTISKTLKRNYDKGLELKNGDVEPLLLNFKKK